MTVQKTHNYDYKTFKMETNDCLVDFNSISSVYNEPTSELFYISYPVNSSKTEVKLDHCLFLPKTQSTNYNESLKHNNLDVQPVSFYEHIHLSRIHYLTFPNFIKLIIIIITFFIFTLNVNKILVNYLKHNTVVNVEYLDANTSTPASVSICTDSLFDLYSQSNRTIYLEDILQNDYILPMFNNSLNNSTVKRSAEMDVKIRCLLLGNTVEDIYSNVHECNDIVAPVVSIADRGSKCWTFFSDISRQMAQSKSSAKVMSFDYMPMVTLQVTGPWLQSRRLFVAVHSPYTLPSMSDVDFHELKPGKFIDFQVSKTLQHFKPPPSLPHCSVYRKWQQSTKRPDEIDLSSTTTNDNLITESGMPIYRTQGECVLYAMLRKLYNFDLQCISPTTIFTQNELELLHFYRELNITKKASNYRQSNSDDNSNYWTPFCKEPLADAVNNIVSIKQQLQMQCPISCHTETFESKWANEITQNTNTKNGYVAVSFAQTVTFIRHRETLGLEHFLGLVGGHLFILINVSAIHMVVYIVSLVHVTEKLPNTSCCCVFQWCRRRCFLRRHY